MSDGLSTHPLKRSGFGSAQSPLALGRPFDFAQGERMWLASDRSAYTTGCVITVGGGHEGFPR